MILRQGRDPFVVVLKKCFDTFDRQHRGFIGLEMVGGILSMMGLKFDNRELRDIIKEIDVDGKLFPVTPYLFYDENEYEV